MLRRVYAEWHDLLVARLSPVRGPTVELGSGIGRFKARFPAAVATDVQPTPFADAVVDAGSLPYGAGELANLVLIDVFHHLPDPARFLDEARRTLAAGGRVLMLEPYCSMASAWAYRRFHHERTDLAAGALEPDELSRSDPLDGNQARATLVFYRHRDQYGSRWPELPIVEERRFALLAYPLSGGFTGPRLLPARLYGPARRLERALAPLTPWLAFRCLLVLERR